jgi:thiosulfate reductase cytochrome b subunit
MPILDRVLPGEREGGVARPVVYRHRLPTRIWHWLNAAVILVMLMSGLMIFNAHPRLYWGQYGANPDPSWLQIGNSGEQGFVRMGNHTFRSTGFLGVWGGPGDQSVYTAFPGWLTIPSTYDLALARHWHLTFAWLFVAAIVAYWILGLGNRHIWQDLLPGGRELGPRHLLEDAKNHALLRFPKGEAAQRYNTLQKLSYLGLVFVLIPLQILTGLTMSPAMDAAWPWLVDVCGGRQSARSIHFICAMLRPRARIDGRARRAD